MAQTGRSDLDDDVAGPRGAHGEAVDEFGLAVEDDAAHWNPQVQRCVPNGSSGERRRSRDGENCSGCAPATSGDRCAAS